MSVIVHGLYEGCVVVEDDNGLGMIPVRVLRDMTHRAVQRDAATASWEGRKYDRDLLLSADDAVRTLGLAELPSCVHCVDGPAVTTDLADRPVCLTHAPDDDAREVAS